MLVLKKTANKILTLLLALAMLFSMAVMPVTAGAEVTDKVKEYYTDAEKSFTGTGEYHNADAGVLANAASARVTYSFKASTAPSTIYGLIGLNTSNTNTYIQFYLKPNNVIGVEIRGNGTKDFNANATEICPNIYDGEWHTVTFEVSENEYYAFYLDNKLVEKETAATTKFAKDIGLTIDKLTLGGTNRGGSYNWTFTGSMKNVKLEDLTATPANSVLAVESGSKLTTEQIANVLALNKGTIAVSYKLTEAVKTTLFALKNSTTTEGLYVDPTTNEIGFGNISVTADSTRLKDTTQWHTIVMEADGTNVKFYLDGTLADTAVKSKLFTITDATDTVVSGDIANATIYDGPLTKTQRTNYVGQTSANILAATYASTYEKYGFFYNFNRQTIMQMDVKSKSYRIPSLVQAGDVTIAAIDERKGGNADNGAIDIQIRRSLDNGETWLESVTISEFGKPVGYTLSGQQPLHIDPCLSYDAENNITYMLVDMFPESSAAMNMGLIQNGSGFFTADMADGTKMRMQALNTVKNGGEGNILYGLVQHETDGTAKVYEPNADGKYVESRTYFVDDYSYGSLKKDPNNAGNFTQDAGNIFVYTTANKGELTVTCTMYVWCYKSYDKGATWTNPINISGGTVENPCKEDWMRFCGTAPGSGIVITGGEHNGRVVSPCYFTNNGSTNLNSQSSAVFYSDDQGKTWQIGESNVEIRLNTANADAIKTYQGGNQTTENSVTQVSADGKLRMYCRNTGGKGKVVTAVSTDGGETWQAPDGTVSGTATSNASAFPDSCYEPITEVYCQLSAITHHDTVNDKYYVIIGSPFGNNGTGRENIGFHIREIDYETGDYAEGSSWIHKQLGDTYEAYSALTTLANGAIGFFWEATQIYGYYYDMVFQSFTMDYLLSEENLHPTETLTVSKEVIAGPNAVDGLTSAGDTIIFTLDTHDPVYISGKPQLKINIGGAVASGTYVGRTVEGGTDRYATYVSGSGTNQIKFAYTVKSSDRGMIAANNAIITSNGSVAENAFGEEYSAVVERYTLLGSVGMDPSVATYDVTAVAATAGNQHSASGTEGPASNVIDNNVSTIWHTSYANSASTCNAEDRWIQLDLGSNQKVNTVRYLPRTGSSNGRFTKYEIQVCKDGENSFTTVATGSWSDTTEWQFASFDTVNARYIRVLGTEARNNFGSCAELRAANIPNLDTDVYEVGDVNNDGSINGLDVTAILKTIVKYTVEGFDETLADVNGDGKINVKDATALQKQIVGLEA